MTFQAADGMLGGLEARFAARRPVDGLARLDLVDVTGIVSLLTVSLDRRVNVSWPLCPGRKMPAGPLGATARTWASCVSCSGCPGAEGERWRWWTRCPAAGRPCRCGRVRVGDDDVAGRPERTYCGALSTTESGNGSGISLTVGSTTVSRRGSDLERFGCRHGLAALRYVHRVADRVEFLVNVREVKGCEDLTCAT